MTSKYWDDFEKRIDETVSCIKNDIEVPTRRVAVFITNKCNFRCKYCNVSFDDKEMTQKTFESLVEKYGKEALIHITGGEPSTVRWLYPFIDSCEGVRFHLNTNAFLTPPKNVKRLKVSLDTNNKQHFEHLVSHIASFDRVVNNIKEATENTIVSITCVLSKQTYLQAPEFMSWCREQFPKLYAVFFSCYKGTNEYFAMNEADAEHFFTKTKPKLEERMDVESLALFKETYDQKLRMFGNQRFPENKNSLCYLSMSERVIDYNGEVYRCSHLFRDGIKRNTSEKHEKCISGCNRRLIKFNEDVENKLKS